MIITASINDQLMIIAAHRYCLGRASYIVGACIEFLDAHWSQLTEETQNVILRDTIEAVDKNHAGMDIDRKDWDLFVKRRLAGDNHDR